MKKYTLGVLDLCIFSFIFHKCAKAVANKNTPAPLRILSKITLFAIFGLFGICILLFPTVAILHLTSANYIWAGFFAIETIVMIIVTYYLYLKVQKYKKEAR